MNDIRAIAHALGGEVVGRDSVIAPGPGHSSKDRSLSVKLSPRGPEGFVVYSHAGDDFAACREHVRGRLGLSRRPESLAARVFKPKPLAEPPDEYFPNAMRIWRDSVEPRGTMVEAYLQDRQLV